MLELYSRLRAVTAAPLCVVVAFHAFVMCWSPAKVKASPQPWIGVVPMAAMVTWATNPPAQLLVVR